MDTRTLIFFASTSAVLVLTFLSLLTPLVGLRRYSYLVYKLALLASVAAFGYRPVYSGARPTSYSLDGLRLWLGTLMATNNAQYVLLCLLFTFKKPAMPLVLAPLAICCAYQWLTVAQKLYAENPLWMRVGAPLFERLQLAMQQALVLCTTVELAVGFQLILQLASSARSTTTTLLYWQWLRMRYKCADNTVLRIKFTLANTAFFHQQVWALLSEKLAPVLRISAVQPVVHYAQAWFTGERNQRP